MNTPQRKGDQEAANEFYALKRAVSENPDNPKVLQRFFANAVSSQNTREAAEFLLQLQQQHPWNHLIRRLTIALHLQHEEHSLAMEAVETLVAFSKLDGDLIRSALSVRNHVGPRTIEPILGRKATISVCMIIKNEQAYLGPCLNAVKSLADEIIVIDTGSSDRSKEVARIYGALVTDFEWCDDFSAARNASLEQANGDWILILDADEIIAPQDHLAIRKIINGATGNRAAYSFQTRNYCFDSNTIDWHANDGSYPHQEAGMGWFPTEKVRLFPRSDRYRFIYPVHELIESSIRQAGLQILKCPVPIHHYGHINAGKKAKKAVRYFELGYAKLDQLGDDKAALRELAIQAGQLERWTKAIELWHRFMKISPNNGEAHANLAGIYCQIGDYDKGAFHAHEAIRIDPGLKEGHYNLAFNLLMNGQVNKASQILMKLYTRNPSYLAAEFMLGAALCLNGNQNESRKVFRTVERKISNSALKVAIEELVGKLTKSGREDDAQSLSKAM